MNRPPRNQLTSARTSGAATIIGAFARTVAERSDAVALRTLSGDTLTWVDYARQVQHVATGLLNLGVAPGDTIAIMLDGRPEMHVVDMGTLHAGPDRKVVVRGPAVMAGYQGSVTSGVSPEGRFRTGDLVTLDTDGFLTWLAGSRTSSSALRARP